MSFDSATMTSRVKPSLLCPLSAFAARGLRAAEWFVYNGMIGAQEGRAAEKARPFPVDVALG